jgi:DNA polymerase II large subunit
MYGSLVEQRRSDMAEGYCLKDKLKVEMVDPQQVTMKNGRPALKGACPKCGGKVFKILPASA